MNKITILLFALLIIAIGAFGQSSDSIAKKKNTKLLIGVWNMLPLPGVAELYKANTKEQMKEFNRMMDSAFKDYYFIYRQDGSYEANFDNIVEGTWWVSDDGKNLITSVIGQGFNNSFKIEELNSKNCFLSSSEIAYKIVKAKKGLNARQQAIHDKYFAEKKLEQEKAKDKK